MSTVLALPVTSENGITISAFNNAQASTRKFAEFKKELQLNDLTDGEIQELVHRRQDK